MSHNPFRASSALNVPLDQSICQRIHYTALRTAARGTRSDPVPDSVSLSQHKQRARLQGASAYLAHPTDVEQIFSDITLQVYQAIEDLYCTPLGRSVEMVWRLLEKMAEQAGVPRVSYEAVWAICTYLEEQRARNSAVTIDQADSEWWITQSSPDVHVRNGTATYRPAIPYIWDASCNRVLGFRVAGEGNLEESISLAIYDSIASLRRPVQNGTTRLIWSLPRRIVTELPVSGSLKHACALLQISITRADTPLPVQNLMRGQWAKDLAGLALPVDHLAGLFDNYMNRQFEHSPVMIREQQEHDFARSSRYREDPAWVFPALREFLPTHAGCIEAGAVEYDGLHYEDDLLAYWPDCPVTLRRSAIVESMAWVYLDGEMLCQAMARELRRADGSYRSSRPGR
jgi:hypothetical protein